MIGARKNQSGTTLLEMVVAVSLFALVMLMVGSIATGVSQGQRSAMAAQDAHESLRYAMEIISKEARQAQRSDDGCELTAGNAINRVYNVETGGGGIGADSGILYFANKNGECVYYYLDNGALFVRRNGNAYAATPDDVVVSDLAFHIRDNAIGALPDDKIQPRATISFKVNSLIGREIEKQETKMQTTVSARFYE